MFLQPTPTPVKTFLRDTPALDNKRAFVFATSGRAPPRVLYDLTALLQSQGLTSQAAFSHAGNCIILPLVCVVGCPIADAHDLPSAALCGAVIEHVSAGRPGPVAESPRCVQTKRGIHHDWPWHQSARMALYLTLPKPKLDPANQCRWCVCRMSNGQHHLAALPELGRRVHSVLSLPDRLSSAGFWRKLVVGQSEFTLALYNTAFVRPVR